LIWRRKLRERYALAVRQGGQSVAPPVWDEVSVTPASYRGERESRFTRDLGGAAKSLDNLVCGCHFRTLRYS